MCSWRGLVLGRQFFQQRLRLLQIARVKPFSEPAVNWREQFARLLRLALVTPEAREARSDALGGQQRRGDGCPFRRKITSCRRAACLPIPITGIVEIALNAVQVSVNPCAVRAFAVSDNLVRFIPIILACPLKRHQRRQKAVWRLPSGETILEVRWGHDRLLDANPRLSVDCSRTCQAHHLVLRPGGAGAADRANELAVLD